MRTLVSSLAVAVAATQPIAAMVYVLDGALIGATDGRFMATSMFVALLVFLPLAWIVLATEAGIVALCGL